MFIGCNETVGCENDLNDKKKRFYPPIIIPIIKNNNISKCQNYKKIIKELENEPNFLDNDEISDKEL